MDEKEAFESRRALLQLYASNSMQYAGFTLAMGVIFVGLLQVLLTGFGSSSRWIHSLAAGSLLSLVVVGFYLFLIAMYWSRMSGQAVSQDPTKAVSQNQMDELLKMHVKAMEQLSWVKRFKIGKSFVRLVAFPAVLFFAVGAGLYLVLI